MSVAGEFERERLGERHDAGLGDVIRQETRVAGTAAPRDPVGEVDDAAAALGAHVRGGGVRTKERRAQVDFERAVPVGDAQIGEWFPRVHRGHVDQDVEPAECIHGALDDRKAAIGRREIGLEGCRSAAGGSHAAGRLFGLATRAGVRERDIGASPRELFGHDEPDPFAAGDQRGLVLKIHFEKVQEGAGR